MLLQKLYARFLQVHGTNTARFTSTQPHTKEVDRMTDITSVTDTKTAEQAVPSIETIQTAFIKKSSHQRVYEKGLKRARYLLAPLPIVTGNKSGLLTRMQKATVGNPYPGPAIEEDFRTIAQDYGLRYSPPGVTLRT